MLAFTVALKKKVTASLQLHPFFACMDIDYLLLSRFADSHHIFPSIDGYRLIRQLAYKRAGQSSCACDVTAILQCSKFQQEAQKESPGSATRTLAVLHCTIEQVRVL